MKITINGNSQLIQANNLEDLLLELKYQGKLATALNENFIPFKERKKTALKDGDRVEIVAPMEGG
ncbi:MAG: sulfur carrier protein ThiS [Pseudomonadota bacterium]|jgi:sulfur carrier protein|nr:sulfur carrier protein ThiS [Pseudomonadota bacterium]|tara:strand:- start:2078 stop:2272 length:195 start_codon:yes stop_codon:yes gene_type:complete